MPITLMGWGLSWVIICMPIWLHKQLQEVEVPPPTDRVRRPKKNNNIAIFLASDMQNVS